MYDIFRDSWIRYLGYANEVGEALRPLVPVMWVQSSYAVATGYMLADTADKSMKVYQQDGRLDKTAIAGGDAFLWQFFASVAIPGFTINRISAATLYVLNHNMFTSKMSPRAICLTAVIVGLSAIPFIVEPIDNGVTYAMDNSYRKVFK